MANRGIIPSLREFVLSCASKGWGVMTGTVCGTVGLIQLWINQFTISAQTLWWVAGSAFVVSVFIAFHKIRVERDEAREASGKTGRSAREELNKLRHQLSGYRNDWEPKDAVGSARWQSLVNGLYTKTEDVLRDRFSPAQANNFKQLAAPPNLEVNDNERQPGSSVREAVLDAKITYLETILAS